MDEIRHSDPVAVFQAWLSEALLHEPNDPEAMCLATVDSAGRPSARMLLLKGVDERGFAFYTNLDSRKGRELIAQPNAALCFHWKSLRRQVRVEGAVEAVSDGEADIYFATRARASQLGAWASLQSQPLDSRTTLEACAAEAEARFAGTTVPRPPNWSGFRLIPNFIEFWQDGVHRLHDRILFQRTENGWTTERLYP